MIHHNATHFVPCYVTLQTHFVPRGTSIQFSRVLRFTLLLSYCVEYTCILYSLEDSVELLSPKKFPKRLGKKVGKKLGKPPLSRQLNEAQLSAHRMDTGRVSLQLITRCSGRRLMNLAERSMETGAKLRSHHLSLTRRKIIIHTVKIQMELSHLSKCRKPQTKQQA